MGGTTYYVMDCDAELSADGEALYEIHNTFRVGRIRLWASGRRFTEPVPEPIPIVFEPFRGYQGPPIELLDVGIPIMSDRLRVSLTNAGVDNLDFYQAILTNSVSGETYKYWAFNVIGLVSAADLGKSEWQSYDGVPVADVSFYNLVLDESRCGGALLFRLAENINALMVHDRVRQRILADGITTLKFIEPKDWMQV